MGIFATRSPVRPNPILITSCKIKDIYKEEGIILIPNIDAEDGTPLLDIKPYIPSLDQILHPTIPKDVPQEFANPVSEEGVGLED
jgi:tRNA (Thr-GGU) A37 N-methylase